MPAHPRHEIAASDEQPISLSESDLKLPSGSRKSDFCDCLTRNWLQAAESGCLRLAVAGESIELPD
jgi:hypothetical protein